MGDRTKPHPSTNSRAVVSNLTLRNGQQNCPRLPRRRPLRMFV
jgi:hypothetical protein